MDGRRQLVFWCVVDDRGQYTALQRADGARALRSARAGSGQSTGAKLTYAAHQSLAVMSEHTRQFGGNQLIRGFPFKALIRPLRPFKALIRL